MRDYYITVLLAQTVHFVFLSVCPLNIATRVSVPVSPKFTSLFYFSFPFTSMNSIFNQFQYRNNV